MSILTINGLATIAKNKREYSYFEKSRQTRMFSKSSAETSIFLSHFHLDRDVVYDAKVFFENLGINIYVDWADETMPEKTNGITAEKIKDQIITQNDKFVLLATNSAIVSKWCNWEVGIADPFKLKNKKMVIFPLADNSGNWNGNEYLQIYPSIEYIYANSIQRYIGGYFEEGYYVISPYEKDGSRYYTKIEDWLKI